MCSWVSVKLTFQETPELRMFQKMLASPYAVVDNQSKVTTTGVVEEDEEKEDDLMKSIMVRFYWSRSKTTDTSGTNGSKQDKRDVRFRFI
jgi:hypothetical protein